MRAQCSLFLCREYQGQRSPKRAEARTMAPPLSRLFTDFFLINHQPSTTHQTIMTRPCKIRPAFAPPVHPSGGLCGAFDEHVDTVIEFRYPGYADHNNILLIFPALDPIPDHDDDNENVTFGLHHETARLACATSLPTTDGTAFCPRRTAPTPLRSRLGRRIFCPREATITSMCRRLTMVCSPPKVLILACLVLIFFFFFSSATDPSPYPVVPSFAHFQFPHGNLPPAWSAMRIPRRLNALPRPSTFDQAVLARDVSCRISLNIFETESAHLIPHAEEPLVQRQPNASVLITTGSARHQLCR